MATAMAIRDLAGVERELAKIPVVGYTVFWRLANVRIGAADFKARLGAAGFAYADPGEPTVRVALRRALDLWRMRYQRGGAGLETGDNTASKIRIVDIATRGDETVFGIVRERRNVTKKSVTHKTEARVFVDNATRALAVTVKDEGDLDPSFTERVIQQQLEPYWVYAQHTLDSGDVSGAILAIVGRLDSVRLRPEGGVYFIPAKRADDVAVLKTLVETLPGENSILGALGIPDLDEYKRDAVGSVHEGLMAELAEAERDLDDLLASGARENTIAAKLREYRKLKLKVETYADALGMQTERAMARLAALSKKVQEAL